MGSPAVTPALVLASPPTVESFDAIELHTSDKARIDPIDYSAGDEAPLQVYLDNTGILRAAARCDISALNSIPTEVLSRAVSKEVRVLNCGTTFETAHHMCIHTQPRGAGIA